MTEQTDNVRAFIEANKKSPVVSGAGYSGGGGCYTLADGRSFVFTVEESRSMEAPRWQTIKRRARKSPMTEPSQMARQALAKIRTSRTPLEVLIAFEAQIRADQKERDAAMAEDEFSAFIVAQAIREQTP